MSFPPTKRTPDEAPKPGIYRDIEPEVYHRWNALNASTLGHFVRSGMHGAYYLNQTQDDDPPTADMLYGTAMHTAYLEPKKYQETAYTPTVEVKVGDDVIHKPILADKCHWKTHKPVADENPGRLILHDQWADRIEDMRKQLDAHPRANMLFNEVDGTNELTLVWHLTVKGKTIPCKCRVDRYLPSFIPNADHTEPVSGIADLKTSASIDPHKFERSIWDYGYHRQAAWYLMGAIAHKLIPDQLHDFSYQIVAVEKKPPYPVTVFPLTAGTIQQGINECRAGLLAYAKYRMHGIAPGPCDSYIPATLPGYLIEDERNAI